MSFRWLIAGASALLLAACHSGDAPVATAAPAVAPILTGADAVDVHSFAKPLEARVIMSRSTSGSISLSSA